MILFFLLLLSSSAFAAQVPIQTLLNTQQRSGVTTSSTFNVPGGMTGKVRVLFDISKNDAQDITKGAKLELLVFKGGSFITDAAAVYLGGVWKNTTMPGFLVNSAEYAGKQVQGRITVKVCTVKAIVVNGDLACNGAEVIGGQMQVGATFEIP